MVAIFLPIAASWLCRRIAQWEAGKPLSKQLWRRIVIAKIRWQAAVLEANGVSASAFDLLARRVGSGDPENVEAQAARRYWPLLMGENFRRNRNAEDINALLNYGYTVLRSMCARAVVASGLHPSIGVHHSNRTNAFALADDLIEPFRPLVDALALRLAAVGIDTVTSEAKRAFAGLIALDLRGIDGTTTVTGAANRAAQTLAQAFQSGQAADLVLPPPRLRWNWPDSIRCLHDCKPAKRIPTYVDIRDVRPAGNHPRTSACRHKIPAVPVGRRL